MSIKDIGGHQGHRWATMISVGIKDISGHQGHREASRTSPYPGLLVSFGSLWRERMMRMKTLNIMMKKSMVLGRNYIKKALITESDIIWNQGDLRKRDH